MFDPVGELAVEGFERGEIELALTRADGVVARAARDLGLTRQSLYRRMEKLGIVTDESDTR